MIQGTLTAMVTPLRGGRVDHDRLAANVRVQVQAGVDGLVPVGTTGESPTLSHAEHREVVAKVVEAARAIRDGVKVVAGTGSNSTDEALELTRHAKDVGADASLQVNPYYNKPTQEGLYRHFMTIADTVDLPVVLYNIPGRTAVTVAPDTLERLAKHPNIVAVKEATGSLDMASEVAARCGDALTILSGDDSLTLPLMSVGGRGVISVASNLVPERVKALVDAGLNGDFAAAKRAHLDLFWLFKAMFIETNPIPVKTAMAMRGDDTGELRLPMCEISSAGRAELQAVLQRYGLVVSQ